MFLKQYLLLALLATPVDFRSIQRYLKKKKNTINNSVFTVLANFLTQKELGHDFYDWGQVINNFLDEEQWKCCFFKLRGSRVHHPTESAWVKLHIMALCNHQCLNPQSLNLELRVLWYKHSSCTNFTKQKCNGNGISLLKQMHFSVESVEYNFTTIFFVIIQINNIDIIK